MARIQLKTSANTSQEVTVPIDPKQWLALYQQKRFGELCQLWYENFRQLEESKFVTKDDRRLQQLDGIIKVFLQILCQPDMLIPREWAPKLLACNPVIGRMIRLSGVGSPDEALSVLRKQQNNLERLLLLYSSCSRKSLNIRNIMKKDPELVAHWYGAQFRKGGSIATQQNYDYFREILKLPVDPMQNAQTLHSYFSVSYILPEQEGAIKRRINQSCQKALKQLKVQNKPDDQHFALLSKYWYPGHAVYNSLAAFVRSLQGRYKLTFINIGEPEKQVDREMFDDVIDLPPAGNGLTPIPEILKVIGSNSFGVLYYPDIGMSFESILLSNMRFAPIQMAGYGHPVSTHGALIDYFITGQQVEDMATVQQQYSERVVSIPGLGAFPERRPYETKGLRPGYEEDKIVISCSWGLPKTNYLMLQSLKNAAQNSDRRLIFKFTGIHDRGFAYLLHCQELKEVLGEAHVATAPYLPYPEYMEQVEACHFAIDSYPFGSFNRIMDSLHVGLPIVTLEGDTFASRCASEIMRLIGLEELVTATKESYAEKIVWLAENPERIERFRAKILNTDMDNLLFDLSQTRYFRKAIDHLVRHHADIKKKPDNSPIIIE